jgi:chemotaxis protein histidine kinase CheA
MSRPGEGFLLVRAGDRRFGLSLSHVVGVTQLETVHSVPAMEPAVRGIADLQGKMVPVVHLGALIDGAPCPPLTGDLGVLVSIRGRRLCLEVDDAELLVQDLGLSMVEGTGLSWAVGVARCSDHLVPLLDLPALSSRFMEVEPT